MLILTLLGIIIFTVGWAFFNLAKKYKKNVYGYTILGVVVFVSGVLIYILLYILLMHYLMNLSRYIHEYLSFAIGVVTSISTHYMLEKKWKKMQDVDAEEAIDEIGKD